MKKKLSIVLSLILAFAVIFCTACGDAKDPAATPDAPANDALAGGDLSSINIQVGTGGSTGTYYGFCNVISSLLKEKTGANLMIQSSGASKANILNIEDGIVDMAIVQNDVMDYAYNGTSLFAEDGAIKSFSTLGAAYAEVCQIVAKADSGIKTVADLKGKKVSVGDSGSGVEFNAQQILGAYDITFEDIDKQNLSFQASADALKDGKIDAFFCTAGAPTVAITDLATTTGIVLVEIDAEHLAKLQEDYGFYAAYTVPAGTYTGIDADATTVAVKATFIVSNELDEETVYQLTKAIYENKDEYSHEKAAEMNLEYAVSSISVPFHPGAERYFKEVGALS
ncbi:MAG: TAXI family TRAP transporter solute-binding subunit [Clostridia bacterium]|nr:TAXI family TRAP transporter solute-binding subunit [Clostridia bacterium]